MKLLKEPLFHFLLLGAAVFALNAWREQARNSGESGESPRIEVSSAVIERLRAGYERQFGRPPDEEELRGLVTAHIREEVLCREALALGLDRDDTIVRRRLAQKMEFLTDDIAGAAEPDETAVAKYFAANAARYAHPPRVSFRHVYFSREKRGADAEAAAGRALEELKHGAGDDAMGDAFLHGFDFMESGRDELSALFGPEFPGKVAEFPAGEWCGPVASSYGLHLVRVGTRAEPRTATLDEVRAAVVRDCTEERRRSTNREVFERLRARYEVIVDDAAITWAAAPVSKTAKR